LKAPDKDGTKLIASNKRARFEYEVLDTFEAGLVLVGTEVKSLRNGKASLGEAYARVHGTELWLHNLDIPEYPQRGYANHEPKRRRKLLMHRNEIDRLVGKLNERGLTIVPLRLYFRKGYAKVELALGRGRKLHDKREKMKRESADREIRRLARR